MLRVAGPTNKEKRTHISRCCSYAVLVDLDKVVDGLKVESYSQSHCRTRVTHLEDKVRAGHDGVCGIWRMFILVFKSQAPIYARKNGHSGCRDGKGERKVMMC
jgi:hypothetical protein